MLGAEVELARGLPRTTHARDAALGVRRGERSRRQPASPASVGEDVPASGTQVFKHWSFAAAHVASVPLSWAVSWQSWIAPSPTSSGWQACKIAWHDGNGLVGSPFSPDDEDEVFAAVSLLEQPCARAKLAMEREAAKRSFEVMRRQ